jgi:hypothetical protein
MGGMFGESKFEVLNKIPAKYVPRTIRISLPVSPVEVFAKAREAGLNFPLIFKPDIGERGFMVERISDKSELDHYLRTIRTAFLVQELVTDPHEFGVSYLRFPTESKGRVVSLVAKEMLSVTGDGRSTLQQLIFENDRAKLQWKRLRIRFRDQLNDVIDTGKKIELVSIGNHARGTRFINANQLVNEQLSETFDAISNEIPGFYFGRFDLRCASLDDLYRGNVRIMELNGCGAEPAHIYDTQFPLWKAFGELLKHWDYIFRIARANNQLGVEYLSHKEAIAFYRKFKSAVNV